MKRLGLAVSVTILVMAFLSGCGSTKSADTPDAVIARVMEECRTGAYEQAARRFEGGEALWKSDPQWVESYLNRICASGEAQSYEVKDRLERSESVVLVQLTTYKQPDKTEGIRTMTWHFERDGAGWLITKVE